MIEIREVKTRKQKKQFIEFPLKLYKNNITPIQAVLFKKDVFKEERN